jgi:hypothetical protein
MYLIQSSKKSFKKVFTGNKFLQLVHFDGISDMNAVLQIKAKLTYF